MKRLLSPRAIGPHAIVAIVVLPLVVAAQSQQPRNDANAAQGAAVVNLRTFEDDPTRYLNQKVTLTGEVQNVLGPRLFTIDERQWIDLDGETLVLLPPPLAALVRENAAVTVTGTVRPFVRADIEREWGWFETGPELEAEFRSRPIVVADSVTGVTDNRVLSMSIDRTATPVGTTGTATGAAITDIAMLAQATDGRIIGRPVDLKSARVASSAANGFWVESGKERLFVVPADATQVKQGQRVDLSGVVLELPAGMKDKIGMNATAHDESIYVYANRVRTN